MATNELSTSTILGLLKLAGVTPANFCSANPVWMTLARTLGESGASLRDKVRSHVMTTSETCSDLEQAEVDYLLSLSSLIERAKVLEDEADKLSASLKPSLPEDYLAKAAYYAALPDSFPVGWDGEGFNASRGDQVQGVLKYPLIVSAVRAALAACERQVAHYWEKVTL